MDKPSGQGGVCEIEFTPDMKEAAINVFYLLDREWDSPELIVTAVFEAAMSARQCADRQSS
jgi:hypothetical protein